MDGCIFILLVFLALSEYIEWASSIGFTSESDLNCCIVTILLPIVFLLPGVVLRLSLSLFQIVREAILKGGLELRLKGPEFDEGFAWKASLSFWVVVIALYMVAREFCKFADWLLSKLIS